MSINPNADKPIELGRYLIEKDPGVFVVGIKIQTRGNDEEFPTFRLLHDGSLYGCHRNRIKQKLEEGDELYEPAN